MFQLPEYTSLISHHAESTTSSAFRSVPSGVGTLNWERRSRV
jgi:hypothetical protein